MSPTQKYQRGATVLAGGGMAVLLGLLSGCGGPKPALPATKPAAATNSAKAPAVVITNSANVYTSVFEDLLPDQGGKDPFYPNSRRRVPATTAPATEEAAPVDTELFLKGIIHAGKHSQAVINNKLFEIGDDQPVTLASGKKVEVRLIEIGSDSVRVQVGENEPITLPEKK